MQDIVFVTGGSGYVGQAIIRRLIAKGHPVRALARSERAQTQVEALGAQAVRGDLLDERALASGLVGVTRVVHAAASLSEATRWTEHERVNVVGTRKLLAAAQAAGVRRFVYVSAASVVISRRPAVGDESLPVVIDRALPYSASKAMAEQMVLAANTDEFTTLAVRPPHIWGEGMHSLPRLVDAFVRGQFVWFDGGEHPYSVCHADNLAVAVELALARGRGGEAYFVTDDERGSMRSFFSALLATQGVSAELRSLPTWVGELLGRTIAWVYARFRSGQQPPLSLELVRMIGRPIELSNAKAKRELGYVPIVSLAEGLERLRSLAPRSPGV